MSPSPSQPDGVSATDRQTEPPSDRPDERGSAEVIGVVLLVGVTVVLVSSFAPFLLGVTDGLAEPPIVDFEFEYDPGNCDAATLTIRHGAGTAVPASELSLSSPDVDLAGTWNDPEGYAVRGVEKGTVRAGTTATICHDDLEHATVFVEWHGGDVTTTLGRWDGPRS